MTKRVPNQQAHTPDEILEFIRLLPISQRAELVQRLLGESGLVVMPKTNASPPVTAMGPEELGQLLHAIAQRLENL